MAVAIAMATAMVVTVAVVRAMVVGVPMGMAQAMPWLHLGGQDYWRVTAGGQQEDAKVTKAL